MYTCVGLLSYRLIGAAVVGMLSAALALDGCGAKAKRPAFICCREPKLLGRGLPGGGPTGTPTCAWGRAEGCCISND